MASLESAAPAPPAPSAQGSRSWLVLLLLLFGEYALLAVSFDVAHWLRHVQLEELRVVRHFGPAFLTGLVATVIVGGKALRTDLQAAFQAAARGPRTLRFLALHATAFGALFALSTQMFWPPYPPRSQAALLITSWLALGLLAIGLLVSALVPPAALLAIASRNKKSLALGAVMAAVAHQAGDLSGRLWEHTTRPTLDVLAGAASWVLPVVYEPDQRVLGTDRFLVHVGAECSGYEGVGLITIFIGGYIFLFRERLHVRRSLAVLLLGMVTMWTANVLRIVILLLVGHYVSPELAVDGFHANLGWLLFLLVALTLVAWLDRSPRFRRDGLEPSAGVHSVVPHSAVAHSAVDDASPSPTTAYLAPQLLVILCTLVTSMFAMGIDWLYGVRIAAGALALFFFRRALPAARVTAAFGPIAIGIGVFALWLALTPRSAPDEFAIAALDAAPPGARALWIAIRALGSTLLIPVVEELAFRGYLLRRLQAPSFTDVPLDRLALVPVLLSSLAFGLVHSEWLAGTLSGIAFAFAQSLRGRTGDAIVAHAVANGLIAITVLTQDRWDLWL